MNTDYFSDQVARYGGGALFSVPLGPDPLDGLFALLAAGDFDGAEKYARDVLGAK